MRDTRLNAGLTSESVFLLSGCLSAMSNPASNQTNDTLSFPPWSLFTVGRGVQSAINSLEGSPCFCKELCLSHLEHRQTEGGV